MRKARIFGLALLALVAVSAVGATAASADEFTATSYPAVVTGVNEPGFPDESTTTSGAVKCTTTTYTGTIKEKSTTLTITPSFSGCTAFGFVATVEMNGCDYLFHINGTTSTTGTVDLVCPAGKEVTAVGKSGATVKCTSHTPAQTNLGTITYSNIGVAGATEEITVFGNISGTKYTHTAGTGVGACTSGSGTTGTYKFKGTLTGEEEAPGTAHIGLTLSNA